MDQAAPSAHLLNRLVANPARTVMLGFAATIAVGTLVLMTPFAAESREPTDALKLRIIGDYSERDENCCGGVPLNPVQPLLNLGQFETTGVDFQDTLARASQGGRSRRGPARRRSRAAPWGRLPRGSRARRGRRRCSPSR